jgi:hypothetical protein
MSRKNPFDFVAFTSDDGTAAIRSDELLRTFDREREFFLMDYIDPRVGFTGKVTGKVLSDDEVRAAIKAVAEYRKCYSYPDGYEEGLRQAFKHRQDPTAHRVEITQLKV